MSESDRHKWNTRYREGAYRDRHHPSSLLEAYAADLITTAQEDKCKPRALDLACGAGRNALYLAERGYLVDAVDVSTEALARGSGSSRAKELSIAWIEHDLDNGLPPGLSDYHLVAIIRYLDLALVKVAARLLCPGGYLICEVHLQSDEAVAGPRSNSFRARPGELLGAAENLEILSYREGLTTDPDSSMVALAQLVAVKRR